MINFEQNINTLYSKLLINLIRDFNIKTIKLKDPLTGYLGTMYKLMD